METIDIMVVGAGVAGITAAIQAGRAGAKTLLVEKNGIPGGTLTAAAVAVPGIFDAWGRQVINGIGWELIAKTLDAEGKDHPDFTRPMSSTEHWRYQINVNPLLFAAISDQELLNAHVRILYHTMVGRAVQDSDGWIVTLCGKDGLFDIRSRQLIDCTGDANLAHIAGCETREPADCQPGTSSAHLANIDAARIDTAELAEAYKQAAAKGDIRYTDLGWNERNAVNGHFQFLHGRGANSNHINHIVAADSERRTQMEIEGRQALLRAYKFLKGHQGLEQLTIEMTALETGVRESRTIVGRYTITEEDYVSGRTFDDAICYSFYPIDIHLSAGLDCRPLKQGVVPQVPLRALLPANTENILAAGRIISSDHAANSALRIQATCMATGQAAAAAAVCAIEANCPPSQAPITAIRNLLIKHNAIL